MAEEIKNEKVTEEVNNAEAPKASNEKRNPRGDKKPNGRVFKEKKDDGIEDRVVFINRVSKTVKGGRRMKFTALVVVGDKNGKYGFALEKAAEVPDAIKKATSTAKKNMFSVHLVKKGATLPHEVVGKYGACNVYLKPAPDGTGVIAGGPVRAILELAGVQNVCSKVYGSRAPINIIRATHNALSNLKNYSKVLALRGKEQKAE